METIDYFWAVGGVLIGSIVLVIAARLLLVVKNRRQGKEIEEIASHLDDSPPKDRTA